MVVNTGEILGDHAVKTRQAGKVNIISNSKEGRVSNIINIGPEEEELNGLMFEEWKRQMSDNNEISYNDNSAKH